MLNEAPARGVQKTSSIGPNYMTPEGLHILPGSQSRFLGLARKRVDRSDGTFS